MFSSRDLRCGKQEKADAVKFEAAEHGALAGANQNALFSVPRSIMRENCNAPSLAALIAAKLARTVKFSPYLRL
jgi:hypothetical protein